MTRQQNRPGVDPQAAQVAFTGAEPILPIERAHLYGRGGVSTAEARAQVRRGLQSLGEALPEVLELIARRAIRQAFLEALPAYWVRRAEELEQVGTPWAWGAAATCRQHGWLLSQGLPSDIEHELDEAVV